jgi:hypothetical protein
VGFSACARTARILLHSWILKFWLCKSVIDFSVTSIPALLKGIRKGLIHFKLEWVVEELECWIGGGGTENFSFDVYLVTPNNTSFPFKNCDYRTPSKRDLLF